MFYLDRAWSMVFCPASNTCSLPNLKSSNLEETFRILFTDISLEMQMAIFFYSISHSNLLPLCKALRAKASNSWKESRMQECSFLGSEAISYSSCERVDPISQGSDLELRRWLARVLCIYPLEILNRYLHTHIKALKLNTSLQ